MARLRLLRSFMIFGAVVVLTLFAYASYNSSKTTREIINSAKHLVMPKDDVETYHKIKSRNILERRYREPTIDLEGVEELEVKVEEVSQSQSSRKSNTTIDSDKTKSDKIQSDKIGSDKIESDKIQSDTIKAKKFESDKIKGDKNKSDIVISDKTESDKIQSDKIQSDKIESDKIESAKVKSDKIKSDKIKAENSKSDQNKSDKILKNLTSDGTLLDSTADQKIQKKNSTNNINNNVTTTTKMAKLKAEPALPSKKTLSDFDGPTQGNITKTIYESGHHNEELNIEQICPNGGKDLALLLLIISAPEHQEARLAIRQTWGHYGSRHDITILFVLGRPEQTTIDTALTQENQMYGDLIRGNFLDTYTNLTLKTISALEWVDQNCAHAKHILKTDDDMFINVPKLLTFLEIHAHEKRVIFGRVGNKWKPIRNKTSKYYISEEEFTPKVYPAFTTGPAYVMTSDIVHELYETALEQKYFKLEDVFTTGIVAEKLGIRRVDAKEFLNRRSKSFDPCELRKTISVHMIKSNEQFDLWKLLLDTRIECEQYFWNSHDDIHGGP